AALRTRARADDVGARPGPTAASARSEFHLPPLGDTRDWQAEAHPHRLGSCAGRADPTPAPLPGQRPPLAGEPARRREAAAELGARRRSGRLTPSVEKPAGPIVVQDQSVG